MANVPCPEEGEKHCTECVAEGNEHCCWCGHGIVASDVMRTVERLWSRTDDLGLVVKRA